jgi:hypothetical protein
LLESFQSGAAINVRAGLNHGHRAPALATPAPQSGHRFAQSKDSQGAEAQLAGPVLQVLGGGSNAAARHIKVVPKLRTSDKSASLITPVYQASSSRFSIDVPR